MRPLARALLNLGERFEVQISPWLWSLVKGLNCLPQESLRKTVCQFETLFLMIFFRAFRAS